MNDNMSPADVAAVVGNTDRNFGYPYPVYPMYGNGFGGNSGFGDGSWLWILIILFLCGGWNNGNGGFGGGFNNDYAWLSNGQKEIMQNTNDGFNTLQLANQLTGLNNSVQGISTQLCGCCADINGNLCNGFAGVNASIANGFAQAEIGANARQMADMNQAFALQSQLAQCCCDNRLASADLKYTIATENCADRTALSDALRDVLESQNAGVQRILDTMCQDKIDAKNERIADLERQLTMANLAASQGAQTAAILANNDMQTAALEKYLAPVPIPAYIVQNPNGCNCNSTGCGCAF